MRRWSTCWNCWNNRLGLYWIDSQSWRDCESLHPTPTGYSNAELLGHRRVRLWFRPLPASSLLHLVCNFGVSSCILVRFVALTIIRIKHCQWHNRRSTRRRSCKFGTRQQTQPCFSSSTSNYIETNTQFPSFGYNPRENCSKSWCTVDSGTSTSGSVRPDYQIFIIFLISSS